ARRNARLLGETGRAPAALLDLQQRVARRLAAAAYLIEEYVGTTPGPAETWLRRALGSRFRQQFHELRMDEPLLDFAPAEGLTGFDPPIHSSLVSDDAAGRGGEDASVAELCATAEDAGVVERALSWMPPESLRYAAPEEPPNEDMVAPVRFPPDVPPATRDAAGYVFISYAHADAARIAPHMRTLHESGVTYWYDAGIPSGAEWDAVIESRIERCRALLLFLSARSAASKYVRREVKFADALDKPLMSLVLEPVALSEGLRMLLTQYQMIDAGGGASREGAGLAAALRGAIGLDKRPSQPRS
ncbi:MAG: toll/interleukin-1 receptor domain-containing protein, partial [Gemmatimonadaceae bacterium]